MISTHNNENSMSHHFDSPESRQDSRINICDIYLFNADVPQTIVAVMTISPPRWGCLHPLPATAMGHFQT